jgi:hypothetical protein
MVLSLLGRITPLGEEGGSEEYSPLREPQQGHLTSKGASAETRWQMAQVKYETGSDLFNCSPPFCRCLAPAIKSDGHRTPMSYPPFPAWA